MLPSGLYLLALLFLSTASGETVFDWEHLESTLPLGISDHTATRSGDIVYLAGGCDAEQGNIWDADAKFFLCLSISQSLFGYDIVNDAIIDDFPDMPVARYRHAAVAANNKIWLVGGRDVEDSPINQVDVFDIATSTWSTVGDLPDEYVVSDHTGFGYNNLAYFIGGYDANYTAVVTVFSIDSTAADPLGSITNHAPLNMERGDISSAIDRENGVVLVAGGFTHANKFCEPNKHSEIYNIADDTWTEVAPLQFGRADKALVYLDGVFYAMGGERQVAGFCDLEVKPEPGERTIPIDQVESFDLSTNTWTYVSDLPVHRFRFPAVAEGNRIYSFGGQVSFNQTCDCFASTDTIIVYTEIESWAPELSVLWNGFLTAVGVFWLAEII